MKPLETARRLYELEQKKAIVDKAYNEEKHKIILECEHSWVFHSDPSGNNDSGYSCSGCDSWVKNRPNA